MLFSIHRRADEPREEQVGQLLLKNLALRALNDPRFRASGSPTLKLEKNGKYSNWTTRVTLSPTGAVAGMGMGRGKKQKEQKKSYEGMGDVELLFLLPKALMNISGPAIVAGCQGFLPPLAAAQRARTPTPPPPAPPPSPPPPSLPPSSATDSSSPYPPKQPRPARPPKPPAPPAKSMYRLLTFSDDLDSPPSSLRYQRGGGPRGHNGIRSLSASLPGQGGSRDFHRLWIGIGRPEERSRVAGYVLDALPGEEVRRVEWDEERGRGGEVVEKAWEEVLRVAYEEEE